MSISSLIDSHLFNLAFSGPATCSDATKTSSVGHLVPSLVSHNGTPFFGCDNIIISHFILLSFDLVRLVRLCSQSVGPFSLYHRFRSISHLFKRKGLRVGGLLCSYSIVLRAICCATIIRVLS